MFEPAEMRLAQKLADRRGISVAALVRILIREEAQRVGIVSDDLAEQAAEMIEYYTNDPEVQEWLRADMGSGKGESAV